MNILTIGLIEDAVANEFQGSGFDWSFESVGKMEEEKG